MASTKWTKEKINSLVSKSNSDEIKESLEEWFINDKFNINYQNNSICELCNHKNLKYEYFIKNKINHSDMLIGSDCIFLFFDHISEITTYVNNEMQQLTKGELRKHLDKLFRTKIYDDVYNENLSPFLKSLLLTYKDTAKLTLKQSLWLLNKVDSFINRLKKIFNLPSDEDILKKIGKTIKLRRQKSDHKAQFFDHEIINNSKLKPYLKYLNID